MITLEQFEHDLAICPRTRQTWKRAWERTPGPLGSTCGAEWRHRTLPIVVKHCGHQTALRPYTVHLYGNDIRIGRCWEHLEKAKAIAFLSFVDSVSLSR